MPRQGSGATWARFRLWKGPGRTNARCSTSSGTKTIAGRSGDEGEPHGTGGKEVGTDGEDGFDPSSARAVHKGSGDHRKEARLKGGLAQRSRLGNAHVDLLHQSRRQGIERNQTQEAGESQGSALGAGKEGARQGEKKPAGIRRLAMP